ncbi:hypothetical protein F5878DRAFT_445402 [Lentinula raphanica]|uniref:Uncharacterized protein n=1 Tax=Lentinula raphanica TaxID=153919 RepID=A0AA38PFL6_9AGAR|nr:hypothetical protein F5878DRAFT_445402 [Lentinula raphanica]
MSPSSNQHRQKPMAATTMTPSREEKHLPASAFSEPSEPSELAPGNKPKDQITKPQEENPQVVLVKDQHRQLKGGAASNTAVKSKL